MAANTCRIDALPCEILGMILEDPDLNMSDVLNFAMTCKRLSANVLSNNSLWKKKFFQRWPELDEGFTNEPVTLSDGHETCKWHAEAKAHIMCRRSVRRKLNEISGKVPADGSLQRLPDDKTAPIVVTNPLFLPTFGPNPMNYYYLIEELLKMIEQQCREEDKTRQMLAYRLLRYIKEEYLTTQWDKFLALPSEQQTLEHGAIILAQWTRPEKRVSGREVTKMLDDIAKQTWDLLAQKYPPLSINRVDRAELKKWKSEVLDKNAWSNEDAGKIISALYEVMYTKLHFKHNPKTSAHDCIDQALEDKSGSPIILGVIFDSIARRLGLCCQIVERQSANLPLRWQGTPNTRTTDVQNCYIVNGKLFTTSSSSVVPGAMKCLTEEYDNYPVVGMVQVLQRMANAIRVNSRLRKRKVNGHKVGVFGAQKLVQLVNGNRENLYVGY